MWSVVCVDQLHNASDCNDSDYYLLVLPASMLPTAMIPITIYLSMV
jgi:hypothetical protein